MIKGSARLDLSGLDRHIQDFAAATARTVKEETRTVFRGMVRDALDYTPPASAGVRGVAAKRAGEVAIMRDLGRMGFEPVKIKGFRIITKAWGRPIEPVRVPVKLNPKFADPEGHHAARIRAGTKTGRGGRVSRGGRQAFYVAQARFNILKTRLLARVGLLASGWVLAANQLGVPVPGYIKRHAGSGRGTALQIAETKTRLTMRVVNHFPSSAGSLATDMIRRIKTFIVPQAVRRLQRQLKANLAGAWGKTRR